MLMIAKALLRHKVISLVVAGLTLAGVVYIVAFTPAVYEVTSSYAFFNPPGPPSAAAVAKDPSLADINADNPFTRFADQAVVIDIIARSVNSDRAREELESKGADYRYTVVPSRRFGSSSPIAEVNGVGDSAGQAINTAKLVGSALERELRALQEAESVDERYMIRTVVVDPPEAARLRISSRLRSLVAVFGLGTVLLFVLVSVAEALDAHRAARTRGTMAPPAVAPTAVGPTSSASTSLLIRAAIGAGGSESDPPPPRLRSVSAAPMQARPVAVPPARPALARAVADFPPSSSRVSPAAPSEAATSHPSQDGAAEVPAREETAIERPASRTVHPYVSAALKPTREDTPPPTGQGS